MITKHVEAYRQRLLSLVRRLGRDLPVLEVEARSGTGGEACGGLSDVPVHPADLGSHQSDSALTMELLEKESETLAEVCEALERIELGTFGFCEACGREVAAARLRALPHARYCVACARRFEV